MRTIAILPLFGACGQDHFLAAEASGGPADPGPDPTTSAADPSDPTDPPDPSEPAGEAEIDGVWLGDCGFSYGGSTLDLFRFRLDLTESGGVVGGDGQMQLHAEYGTYSYTSPPMAVGAEGDFDGSALVVDILVGPQETVFGTIDGVVTGDTWTGELSGEYSSSSTWYSSSTSATVCELVRQ